MLVSAINIATTSLATVVFPNIDLHTNGLPTFGAIVRLVVMMVDITFLPLGLPILATIGMLLAVLAMVNQVVTAFVLAHSLRHDR